MIDAILIFPHTDVDQHCTLIAVPEVGNTIHTHDVEGPNQWMVTDVEQVLQQKDAHTGIRQKPDGNYVVYEFVELRVTVEKLR